jgi:hypothetical protein
MAIDFKYYLRGANIALIEKDTETANYKSPAAAIENGLMLEYSAMPTVPDDETDALDLTEELCLAAVEYLKAKFAENEQQYDKRNFHMKEFKRLVYTYQKNRFGGMRRVMDKAPYAIV